jgi:maltose 6'-phosphate phosphatase
LTNCDVDLVCLQEVAELWNNGKGDWQTNGARIINQRLQVSLSPGDRLVAPGF